MIVRGRSSVAVVVGLVVMAGAAGVARAGGAEAGVGPVFGGSLVEMTPGTLDRFGKALTAEEGGRRRVADGAAGAQAKQRLTRQQFDECQMRLVMSPEYRKLMEQMSQVMHEAKPTTSWQTAMQEVAAKQEALQQKECGPDPSRNSAATDVAGELRQVETDVARENGFTPRQYAILKERVAPLCLADPVPPDPGVARVPAAQKGFYYVYTAGEVRALRPHCQAFLKLLYPAAR